MKEFVPYEQAIALKELGFNKPCLNLYHDYTHQLMYKPIDGVVMIKIDNHNKTNHCSAPTLSQAFRWFREKYNLSAWVTSKTVESNTIYIPCGRTIPDTTKKELVVDVVPYVNFKNYEEAELECLKKLIEIVNNK